MFLNCQWILEDLPHQMRPLAYQVFCFVPGQLFLLQLEMLLGNTVESLAGKGFPADPASIQVIFQPVSVPCVLGFQGLSWKKCQSVHAVSL